MFWWRRTSRPCPLIDATADFRPLIAATEDAECRVHGVIHNNVDSDRLGAAPIAMVRAAATNYWAQGVDGLNLIHWAGSWPYGRPSTSNSASCRIRT